MQTLAGRAGRTGRAGRAVLPLTERPDCIPPTERHRNSEPPPPKNPPLAAAPLRSSSSWQTKYDCSQLGAAILAGFKTDRASNTHAPPTNFPKLPAIALNKKFSKIAPQHAKN